MAQTKKRKRRSFWEPESKPIIEWMNNQSDLGKSLQLVIVDAIKQYGKGDAVDAYLQRRLLHGDEELLADDPPKQKTAQKTTAQRDNNTVPAATADIEIDLPTETVAEHTQSEQVLEAAPIPKEEPVKDTPAAPKAEVKPKTQAKVDPASDSSSDDYNPIDIMFGDIESEMK